ncbi:MAG: hypothetical protein AB7K24_16855 [Gemmataceae bacterium]
MLSLLARVGAARAQDPRDIRIPEEDQPPIAIQLDPPGMDRVFQLESEAALQERMRQEARGRRPQPERIQFPEETKLNTGPYQPRVFPPLTEVIAPNYLCHQRLYFYQPNLERYGWDLGAITPFVSAAKFYFDVITWPYHIGTEPCRRFECSAGQCLPGDPVPLLLYPPKLSVPGTALEAATMATIFLVFP